VVNDLVSKGGFPQLLINPVNFEMLYQQKQDGDIQDGHSAH
jgi:preprotein translocase subunit SecB